MPSINKTPNVGLNQWKGNEYIIRQDWADDNLAIDTKFKEVDDKFNTIKVPSNPSDIGAETPTGAQEKANKAEANAKAYTNEKIETVNASLDKKMNKQISDDATTKKYELGIKNGLLYYREVV